MTTKPSRSGHLPINGLNVYFEVTGNLDRSTAPLLLIPGAYMSVDSMSSWVEAFAADRAVIVFDQQGHGKTPDAGRPMSYEQFGDDAAELLRALSVERADVMGYSQGGGVAIQLAIRHPSLVSHLVSMSATYRRDGWHPSVTEVLSEPESDVDMFAGTAVERDFKAHTSDPAACAAYREKMKALNANDQQISDDAMRAISARTMVIVGDADGVTLEHAVAMFELRGGGDLEAAATGALQRVPNARLVILPAMSHVGMSAASGTLVPMITAFLDDVQPVTPELF